MVALMRLTSVPQVQAETIEIWFFAAAAAVLAVDRPRAAIAFLGIAGAIAAAITLGKLNSGPVVVAILLIVAGTIARPWWRGLAVAAIAYVVSLVVLWLLAGQRIGDTPAFGRAFIEIVGGYSSAMGTPGKGLPVARVAAVIEIAVLAALGFALSRDWRVPRRIALALIWVVFAGAIFLEGFTRDDPSHHAVFFIVMAVVSVVVLPRGRQLLGVGLLAGFVSLAVVALPIDLGAAANPLPSIGRFVSDTATAIQPWTWTAASARTRADIAAAYGIDPRLEQLVTGKTVHIDPVDTALSFALPGTRWDPEPVFQSYQAYTPILDQLNASFLAGPSAPAMILRREPRPAQGGNRSLAVVDGRLAWWEQPATTLEMLCRYRESAVFGTWQVLVRDANACGAPEALLTVTATAGQVIPVPDGIGPNDILVVRIAPLAEKLTDRALSVIRGARPWYALVDGVRYRLVAATAGDGLLLEVPERVGWSPGFSFGSPVHTLAVTGGASGGTPITFQFEVIPYQP